MSHCAKNYMNPYFAFLRIAIGVDDNLPFTFSDADWQRVFDFCKRQSLIGVGFTAVERLHRQGVDCPKGLMMKWMALAIQIEERNRRMNDACRTVTGMFESDGFDCCILKGQGNTLNYPAELALRRQSGDIDIWVRPRNGGNAVRQAIEYAKKHSEQTLGPRFMHTDMHVEGDIEVEVHYRATHLNSPLRYWRLQQWTAKRSDLCMRNKTELGFAVPTPSVNVVYQLTHIFKHFFDEGIGLRQLMDYYFVLKRWHDDCAQHDGQHTQGLQAEEAGEPVMSKEEVMHALRSFAMAKFAAAVMWVLNEVFSMPAQYYICEPDEKTGKQLLKEIMLAGNFGKHDERGKDMRTGGKMAHAVWKLGRIMRQMGQYPEEALCEPPFRLFHFFWRVAHR